MFLAANPRFEGSDWCSGHSRAAEGYHGPLCSRCDPGWSGGTSEPCIDCRDYDSWHNPIAGAVGFLVAMLWYLKTFYFDVYMESRKREAGQQLKPTQLAMHVRIPRC